MGDQTVIGGDKNADVTIVGNDQLVKSPVTITKDTITGHFTLLSSTNVTVNNKSVTTKVLEPGDVINFNGTIVVFDDQDGEKAGEEEVGTAKGRPSAVPPTPLIIPTRYFAIPTRLSIGPTSHSAVPPRSPAVPPGLSALPTKHFVIPTRRCVLPTGHFASLPPLLLR